MCAKGWLTLGPFVPPHRDDEDVCGVRRDSRNEV